MKKKHSAAEAWKIMVLSLPKGILSFVVATVGLAVSLPLSVFLIGIPLLAGTLLLLRGMMDEENRRVTHWIGAERPGPAAEAGGQAASGKRGWRAMTAVLAEGRSYRSLLYSFLQLPVGIASFTIAIVLPVTVFAVLLSPLAYEISHRLFHFELFTDPMVLDRLLPELLPYQRAWAAAGLGAVLTLLLPLMLRVLGRFYASWVQEIGGELPQPTADAGGYAEATPAAEMRFGARPAADPVMEQPPAAEPLPEGYKPPALTPAEEARISMEALQSLRAE